MRFDPVRIPRRTLAAMLAAASCFVCSAQAWADDFAVAVESIDYPPLYNGTDPNNYRGFARDLLDLFGARYQHHFHYIPLPINRLFAEFFTAGDFDFKFPDNPKWQTGIKKGLTVSYSDPVVSVTEGLFVERNKAGRGPGKLKSMATLTGFTPHPYAALVRDGSVRLYFADNLDSLYKMLSIGRIDGIYASDVAMRTYADNHGNGREPVVLDRSLPSTTAAFCLSTLKHPELIAQFNQFLVVDHEKITALKKKYGISVGEANEAAFPGAGAQH